MEDLDPDSIPPEARDPADEKARVLGLIDDRDDDEAGDACDLCTGHGTLRAQSLRTTWCAGLLQMLPYIVSCCFFVPSATRHTTLLDDSSSEGLSSACIPILQAHAC